MNRTDTLTPLQQSRDALSKLGVAHLSVYVSVARDQAYEFSDVDVVVDTADGEAPGLFRLAQISDQLERLLDRPVDVISRRGLEHTTSLKRRVAADLVHVF
jgi:predicted nucleotidyltransferase